ncbi:MAG: protein tyrosine phosphatase [Hyphomicrobiales bacterium]
MIIVSPLHAVQGLVTSENVSHVVSLLSPSMTPPTLKVGAGRHLHLTMHDIDAPADGFLAPEAHHMETLIAFVEGWQPDAPLLVHCFAGISRSTAAAYTAMCLLSEPGEEQALAAELRAQSPQATPNRRMVALADDLLGRQGRMVDAISAIGRGEEAMEGRIFSWRPRRA